MYPVERLFLSLVPVLEETIVNSASSETTGQGSHKGDPGVEVVGGEYIQAPAGNGSEEARSKVPGRIQSKASLKAERSTNTGKSQAKDERSLGASGIVVGIRGGKNDEQEHKSTNEFIEKATENADVILRISGKNATGCVPKAAKARSLECRVVSEIDDSGANECTNELRDPVQGQLGQGEATENSKRQGDSGVEMSSRNTTGDIDTSCQAKAKANVDVEPTAISGTAEATAEDGGSDGASAKNHKYGCAKELRKKLT